MKAAVGGPGFFWLMKNVFVKIPARIKG